MAVELEVISGRGDWVGSRGNLAGYNITESATPLHAGDTSGAVGSAQFVVASEPGVAGSRALLDSTLKLSDDKLGVFIGVTNEINDQDGEATVSVDSKLIRLTGRTVMPYYNGTLGGAITAIMTQAGYATNEYSIDASITGLSCILPAYEATYWDGLKNMCPVYQFEVALVSGLIVFRAVHQREGILSRDTTRTVNVNANQIAEYVEIYNYNHFAGTALAYPDGELVKAQVLDVDTGDTAVFSLDLNGFITSFDTPTYVETLPTDTNTGSVYSAVDKDGVPITLTEWTAGGGKATLAAGETTQQALFTVTAPNNMPARAPFRLALPVEPWNPDNDDVYPAVRIIGTGVFIDKQVMRIATGADPNRVAEEVGITIDNPVIGSAAMACALGAGLAYAYSGRSASLSASTPNLNSAGSLGGIVGYTYNKFMSDMAGVTYNAFQTMWAGKTYAQFQAYYLALASDKNIIQVIGNAPGARVRLNNSYYRIRDVSYTEAGLQYSGDADTMFNDFTATFSGLTYTQFAALLTGVQYQSFGLDPLWRP